MTCRKELETLAARMNANKFPVKLVEDAEGWIDTVVIWGVSYPAVAGAEKMREVLAQNA